MLFSQILNKYYKKYLFFIILGLVALVVVDYFQLFIPEFLGQIVDYINGSITLNVNKTILYVVGVAFILWVGRIAWRLSLFYTSKKIEASLREEMFNKALEFNPDFYHQNNVGSIMSLFTTDLETISEFLGWGTIMIVDATFLSVLVIYKMLNLDYILSIICFIPIILLIIWGLLVEKIMTERWDLRQQAFDKLYDYTQENFTGIRVIKAFVKENKEIHYFSKIAKKNETTNVSFARMSVLFDILITILIAAIMSLLLGFGGFFVYKTISGNNVRMFGHTIDLSVGSLVTFISYFESLIWPMIALGRIVSMRSRAKTSLSRITRFLNTDVSVKNPENALKLDNVKGKIEFKNFSFRYEDGNTDSIKNISLVINPGENIGVIGRLGSGKTTLINSLFRLYNVNGNEVFIDDYDIMTLDIKTLRDNISYVPQDNFLFSDKIKNNIAFSSKSMENDLIYDAAKFSDVDGNILGFSDGYDTIIGERGVSLSGGQKQRISISRAYAKKAPIMILDDSVSAVDIKTEENILNNIKKYRKGLTTILIASRVSSVKNMDKIIVLNNGELEAFDTPENLAKTSETYKNMVFLQSLEDGDLNG